MLSKMLFFFMILPVMLFSEVTSLPSVFEEANMIKIYNDGQEIVMTEEKLDEFSKLFMEAVKDARQMPAFGVAIHKLTVEEMKSGIWVKFVYNNEMQASGMPFDELVIALQPNMYGFNVIRGFRGKYNGRCFYLDLDGTLDNVYNYVVDVIDGKVDSSKKEDVKAKENTPNEELTQDATEETFEPGNQVKEDKAQEIIDSVEENEIVETSNELENTSIKNENSDKNENFVIEEKPLEEISKEEGKLEDFMVEQVSQFE